MKVKDTLKKYLSRYFIDAMGSMAQGLFASLLIGTILATLAKYLGQVESLVGLATAINTRYQRLPLRSCSICSCMSAVLRLSPRSAHP